MSERQRAAMAIAHRMAWSDLYERFPSLLAAELDAADLSLSDERTRHDLMIAYAHHVNRRAVEAQERREFDSAARRRG